MPDNPTPKPLIERFNPPKVLNNRSLSDAQIQEAIQLYTEKGWGVKKIAIHFKLKSHGVVRNALKKYIELRPQGRPKDPESSYPEFHLTPDQVTIAVHFYQAGWSCERIASCLYTYPPVVHKVLVTLQIPLRKHLGGERHDKDAIMAVQEALRRGELRRQPCEQCGAPVFVNGKLNVIAHHDDYNFPLIVRWLCHRCHRSWHQHNLSVMRTTGVAEDEPGSHPKNEQ